jgi:hypothetical protein
MVCDGCNEQEDDMKTERTCCAKRTDLENGCIIVSHPGPCDCTCHGYELGIPSSGKKCVRRREHKEEKRRKKRLVRQVNSLAREIW